MPHYIYLIQCGSHFFLYKFHQHPLSFWSLYKSRNKIHGQKTHNVTEAEMFQQMKQSPTSSRQVTAGYWSLFSRCSFWRSFFAFGRSRGVLALNPIEAGSLSSLQRNTFNELIIGKIPRAAALCNIKELWLHRFAHFIERLIFRSLFHTSKQFVYNGCCRLGEVHCTAISNV